MQGIFNNFKDFSYVGMAQQVIFHQRRLKAIRLPKGMSSQKLSPKSEAFRSMKKDARNYPRYGVHKIVSYARGAEKLLTLTLDLGLGGMKIKACHRMAKDEQLIFKLVLGNRSIELKGRIVYSRVLPRDERVAGVQFTKLSAEDFSLLQKYLANLEA